MNGIFPLLMITTCLLVPSSSSDASTKTTSPSPSNEHWTLFQRNVELWNVLLLTILNINKGFLRHVNVAVMQITMSFRRELIARGRKAPTEIEQVSKCFTTHSLLNPGRRFLPVSSSCMAACLMSRFLAMSRSSDGDEGIRIAERPRRWLVVPLVGG